MCGETSSSSYFWRKDGDCWKRNTKGSLTISARPCLHWKTAHYLQWRSQGGQSGSSCSHLYWEINCKGCKMHWRKDRWEGSRGSKGWNHWEGDSQNHHNPKNCGENSHYSTNNWESGDSWMPGSRSCDIPGWKTVHSKNLISSLN